MSVSAAPEQMCQPKSMNFVRKMYVGTRIPSVEPHGLARGFSQPVKYRAEKSGEIYMVLSCMDGNISTVYHHPDITYRKIQNGQDGKFYDEDLKVAFYKLQSEYYYHLSKEIEFEVESEYFQKTNNERKGDVKQHAKNL